MLRFSSYAMMPYAAVSYYAAAAIFEPFYTLPLYAADDASYTMMLTLLRRRCRRALPIRAALRAARAARGVTQRGWRLARAGARLRMRRLSCRVICRQHAARLRDSMRLFFATYIIDDDIDIMFVLPFGCHALMLRFFTRHVLIYYFCHKMHAHDVILALRCQVSRSYG